MFVCIKLLPPIPRYLIDYYKNFHFCNFTHRPEYFHTAVDLHSHSRRQHCCSKQGETNPFHIQSRL